MGTTHEKNRLDRCFAGAPGDWIFWISVDASCPCGESVWHIKNALRRLPPQATIFPWI
jgi:hypothetical protein